MSLLRLAAVAPLVFLAPAQTGCGFIGCTLIGGIEGLHLSVEPTTSLPLDTYTIVARAEDRELRATVQIVEGGSECVTECWPRVALPDGRELSLMVGLGPTGGSLTIGFNQGGPGYVEVDVLRGDTLVASGVYEPEYRTHYPNGKHCDDGVRQAQGTLVVPL